MRYAVFPMMMAGPALAHPGAHVHPHDGVSWLTVAFALAGIAIAGGAALSKVRAPAEPRGGK